MRLCTSRALNFSISACKCYAQDSICQRTSNSDALMQIANHASHFYIHHCCAYCSAIGSLEDKKLHQMDHVVRWPRRDTHHHTRCISKQHFSVRLRILSLWPHKVGAPLKWAGWKRKSRSRERMFCSCDLTKLGPLQFKCFSPFKLIVLKFKCLSLFKTP